MSDVSRIAAEARPSAVNGVRGERVIARTDAAWQSQQVEEPCILENPKDPTRLVMLYSGVPAADRAKCYIGKAWALKSDPFTWRLDPNNPVFEQAASGWDSRSIRLDCVLYVPEDDAYYIYYSGTDVADAHNRIGLAICPAGSDGYSGIIPSAIRRYGITPVLAPEPAEPFAESMVSQAAVWRERDAAGQWRWYLYYSYRGRNGVLPGIRLATSTDGKTWQRQYNHDDPRGMGHLFVSTPDAYYEWHQVFKVDDTFVLSMEVGPNRGERWRTVLAVSRHPDRGWEQLDVDTVLQTRWPGIYSDTTMFHVATPAFYRIDERWHLYTQACPLPDDRNYISGQWDLWAFACDRRIPTRPGLADVFIPGVAAPPPPARQPPGGVAVPAAIADDPLLTEAYRAAAQRNVLRALNPKIFFGYFSVCADGKGHGSNTTFPGLDWGQSAEALLWLGRKAEVLASWEYVKGFQRDDGLVPFAILPDSAGTTAMVQDRYPLVVDARGAVFEHWVPGNPLRTLANVTFLLLADAIWSQTGDRAWLQAQVPCLRKAAEWLVSQITPDGLMRGGGFYVERPTRLEYDGINQCYSAHALAQVATLFDQAGETTAAPQFRAAAQALTDAFRARFWAGDHCVEYIHPEHGPVSRHGLTDVDWAAVATRTASNEQIAALWPQLKDNANFIYSGMPGGIATKPETYEDWEMQQIDRHDLAAMGRVWFLECWARARMGDRAGLLHSLRQVAAAGRANDWSWMERYYSEKTGDLGKYHFQYYCEYPASFIRIVNRFVGGDSHSDRLGEIQP